MDRRDREDTKSDVKAGVQLAWYLEKLFAPNNVPPNKRETRFARLDAIQKKLGLKWRGATKSYPPRITRHLTEAKLVSPLHTRSKNGVCFRDTSGGLWKYLYDYFPLWKYLHDYNPLSILATEWAPV